MRLELWDDTRIKTGNRWQKEIEKALESANLAILLVSHEFLASRFIKTAELPTLLQRANTERLKIIWLAVGASAYDETPIMDFQCANEPTEPLASLPTKAEQNEALVKICKKIKGLVQ